MKRKPRGDKGELCGVKDCKEESDRSVSYKKIQTAMKEWNLAEAGGRRIKLCKTHYKQFRKKTKKDRELERLTWND